MPVRPKSMMLAGPFSDGSMGAGDGLWESQTAATLNMQLEETTPRTPSGAQGSDAIRCGFCDSSGAYPRHESEALAVVQINVAARLG